LQKGYLENKKIVPSLPDVGGSIADSSAEVQGENTNDLLNGNSSETISNCKCTIILEINKIGGKEPG